MPLYSICTTCYNSDSCVDGFMEPFTKLGNDYELVIVDGGSTDGTYDKLLKYSGLNNFKLIRQKCSRGKGRQIAMEASSAPVVAHVDFDVSYLDIVGLLNLYEKINVDRIYHFNPINPGCGTPVIIGNRKLFTILKGFGDVNAHDDMYFFKKADSVNLRVHIGLNFRYMCLKINDMTSSSEKRYSKNFLSRLNRRILLTRHLLFVSSGNYDTVKREYKLNGWRAIIEVLPEYILGKLLLPSVKAEKLDKAIPEVRKRYKEYLEEREGYYKSTESLPNNNA